MPPFGKYRVILWWNEDDHAFLAQMPELPGCMAPGTTQEEALDHLREVAALWMEWATDKGREIPPLISLSREDIGPLSEFGESRHSIYHRFSWE